MPGGSSENGAEKLVGVCGARRRSRRARIAAMAVVAMLGAACSGGSGSVERVAEAAGATSAGPSGSVAPGDEASGPVTDDAEDAEAYGYSARRDAAVTYQPDVVIITNGASAVRDVSANGLVWTMDASARGVKDLKLGSVMFATCSAVGRVVAIEDTGPNRVVTLGPVELTEVVRDGTIDLSRGLDLSTFAYQEIPDLPGALSEPTDDDLAPGRLDTGAGGGQPTTTIVAAPGEWTDEPLAPAVPGDGDGSVVQVVTPTLRLAARADGSLPLPQKGSITVPVGDWTVKPYGEATKLGVNIAYKASEQLKVFIDFAFATKDLHIDSEVSIKSGQVTKSGFVVNGITGLDVSVSAGLGGTSVDNSKIKIEVPVEINAPIPPSPATAGLPVNIKVTYKFVVETALTGTNSTLVAAGKYGLDGPIGVSGGQVHTPSFTVKQSIIDSISGITLGPSGIVVAVGMKLQAGIGTAAATVGPYGSLTTSLGLTNGSSLGAPLARCHSATLDIKSAVGVGLSVSPSIADALRGFFPPKTKIELGIETSTSLLRRSQVVPDVPLCRG